MKLTTILASAFALLPLGATADGEACSYSESGVTYRGTCGSPYRCTTNNGFWVAGKCPGGDSNRCCLAASCTGGICLNSNTSDGVAKCRSRGGAFIRGLCPAVNVYCCK